MKFLFEIGLASQKGRVDKDHGPKSQVLLMIERREVIHLIVDGAIKHQNAHLSGFQQATERTKVAPRFHFCRYVLCVWNPSGWAMEKMSFRAL